MSEISGRLVRAEIYTATERWHWVLAHYVRENGCASMPHLVRPQGWPASTTARQIKEVPPMSEAEVVEAIAAWIETDAPGNAYPSDLSAIADALRAGAWRPL